MSTSGKPRYYLIALLGVLLMAGILGVLMDADTAEAPAPELIDLPDESDSRLLDAANEMKEAAGEMVQGSDGDTFTSEPVNPAEDFDGAETF